MTDTHDELSEHGKHDDTESIITRRLLIHGKVQGVSYRASAQAKARELALHGWVRNLRSGDVEAVVSGPEDVVESFIDWARQGPPAAQVALIEISAADTPAPGPFSRLPDA